jgi:hypothetical protein
MLCGLRNPRSRNRHRSRLTSRETSLGSCQHMLASVYARPVICQYQIVDRPHASPPHILMAWAGRSPVSRLGDASSLAWAETLGNGTPLRGVRVTLAACKNWGVALRTGRLRFSFAACSRSADLRSASASPPYPIAPFRPVLPLALPLIPAAHLAQGLSVASSRPPDCPYGYGHAIVVAIIWTHSKRSDPPRGGGWRASWTAP